MTDADRSAAEFVEHCMWSEGEDNLDWCVNLPDFLAQPLPVQAAIRRIVGVA